MDKNRNARAVLDDFHRWARAKSEWTPVYKKLPLVVFECIFTSFEELEILKPNMYDAWWLQNNSRFDLSGRDIRNMRNLMHLFLTDLHYKKIPAPAESKPISIPLAPQNSISP